MSISLDHFVNRDQALDLLDQVIHRRREERVILVTGKESIGKSFLLHRCRQDCSNMKVAHVWIEFVEYPAQNFLFIVEETWVQLSRQLDSDGFELLAKAMTAPHPSAPLPQENELATEIARLVQSTRSPGAGASVSGDVHAGRDFVGRDSIVNHINVFAGVREQVDTEQQARILEGSITQAFYATIKQIASEQPVVFFIDAWHRLVNPVLRDWLTDKLLTWIRDGQFPHACAVVAHRHDLPGAFQWQRTMALHVDALEKEFALQYLQHKRKLDARLAREIHAIVDGNPFLLRLVADEHQPPALRV